MLAVPGEITSALSRGTNDLLRLGATPLLGSADVLDLFGLAPAAAAALELTDVADKVLGRLRDGPASADELARATGLEAGALASALTELELAGVAVAARRCVPGQLASRHGRRTGRERIARRAERRGGSADRGDRESRHPQPRDHRVLLAPRRGVRGAEREGANWCTYATWASRQAGGTIRGEDLLEELGRKFGRGGRLLHPIRTLWRRAAAPRPLPARDADRAPDGRAAHAVRRVRACERRRRAREPEGVRGDRARVRALPPRVPARRGRLRCVPAVPRRTAAGRPARGSALPAPGVRAVRARAARARPEGARWSSPSSRTSRSASTSRRASSRRSARRSTPRMRRRRIWAGARSRQSFLRQRAGGRPSGVRPPPSSASVAAGAQRGTSRLAREVITESLMVLVSPGTGAGARHAPGRRLPARRSASRRTRSLLEFLARFEPLPPAPDDCGARDWSDLHQRMHYIVHLFCAFHLRESSRPPALHAGAGGELQPRHRAGRGAVIESRARGGAILGRPRQSSSSSTPPACSSSRPRTARPCLRASVRSRRPARRRTCCLLCPCPGRTSPWSGPASCRRRCRRAR